MSLSHTSQSFAAPPRAMRDYTVLSINIIYRPHGGAHDPLNAHIISRAASCVEWPLKSHLVLLLTNKKVPRENWSRSPPPPAPARPLSHMSLKCRQSQNRRLSALCKKATSTINCVHSSAPIAYTWTKILRPDLVRQLPTTPLSVSLSTHNAHSTDDYSRAL